MRFCIVTNITNGVGLEREYRFLRRLLESYGHQVDGVMYTADAPPHKADVAIFIELLTCDPRRFASQVWLMPHSEWWGNQWNQFLPHVSKVLCKTKDCYRIWNAKVGAAKCVYTAFESLDFYNPEVVKQPTFLHIPGKSTTRQTEMVAGAWRKYKLPYSLTIVHHNKDLDKVCVGIPNVKVLGRQSDEEIARLMNENLFYIHPSRYEGFGHAIHEALGCGAIVLTTNAPPMNDFRGIEKEVLIPVSSTAPWRLAVANYVSPEGVATAVHFAAQLPEERRIKISQAAREGFLSEREEFRNLFQQFITGMGNIGNIGLPLSPSMTILSTPTMSIPEAPTGLIAMRMGRDGTIVHVNPDSAATLERMKAATRVTR